MPDEQRRRREIQHAPDLSREVNRKQGVIQESRGTQRHNPFADRIVVFPLFVSEPRANSANAEPQEALETIGPG